MCTDAHVRTRARGLSGGEICNYARYILYGVLYSARRYYSTRTLKFEILMNRFPQTIYFNRWYVICQRSRLHSWKHVVPQCWSKSRFMTVSSFGPDMHSVARDLLRTFCIHVSRSGAAYSRSIAIMFPCSFMLQVQREDREEERARTLNHS